MTLQGWHATDRVRRWASEEALRVRAAELAAVIGSEMLLSVADLLEGRGNRRVWDARHRLYLALWNENASIAQIARALGRDHTTVMHGLRKILGGEEYAAQIRSRWDIDPKSYRGKPWAA